MNKKFTRADRQKIESIWTAHWNKRSLPEFGLPEAWLSVITDYLAYTGHNLVRPEVEEMEMLIVSKGKSKEYLKTLIAIMPEPEDANMSDRLVYALAASEEDRLKALRFVLNP